MIPLQITERETLKVGVYDCGHARFQYRKVEQGIRADQHGPVVGRRFYEVLVFDVMYVATVRADRGMLLTAWLVHQSTGDVRNGDHSQLIYSDIFTGSTISGRACIEAAQRYLHDRMRRHW